MNNEKKLSVKQLNYERAIIINPFSNLNKENGLILGKPGYGKSFKGWNNLKKCQYCGGDPYFCTDYKINLSYFRCDKCGKITKLGTGEQVKKLWSDDKY